MIYYYILQLIPFGKREKQYHQKNKNGKGRSVVGIVKRQEQHTVQEKKETVERFTINV